MNMTSARPIAPYLIWHEVGKGVIARYHLDTDEINKQLASLREAGADGISLSLWLYDGIGENDQFLDWSNGTLADQPKDNLLALLQKIKSLGFNFVQLAPQFYNTHDPRQNPFSQGLYTANWIFISSLPALLDSVGLPYLIDACPEVNDVYLTNPGLQAYAKRLWMDITSWFYPGGKPCWNFSFSFIPSNWSVLEDVFQGNPPAIVVPHLYANELGGLYPATVQTKANLPSSLADKDWLIGETHSLPQPGDITIAQDLSKAIVDTKVKILRVCPWPLDPRNTTLVPAQPGQWATQGF